MCCGAYRARGNGIDAKPSVWTFLGDASYTLYLTHVLPIELLLLWWSAHPAAPDLIILIGSGVAILFAWRMYVLVEISLLKLSGCRMGAFAAHSKPQN